MFTFKSITIVGAFFILPTIVIEIVHALINFLAAYGIWIGIFLVLVILFIKGVITKAMRNSNHDGTSHFFASVIFVLFLGMLGYFVWLTYTA